MLRTAEEIIKENFAWIPKSLAPDNVYEKFLQQMKVAINEARIEAIKECAEMAKTKYMCYGLDDSADEETIVDKQSILKLINELK